VDGVGDALDLLFQCFIQPVKSRNGVPESAMGHFIRRKALAKEFLSPVKVLLKGRGAAYVL